MFRKMMAWIVAGTMMAGCLPVATASADGQPIDLRGRELGSLSSETGRIEVPQFNIVELKSGSMPADLRFSCSNPAFDIDMSKAGFMYDTNMNIKISGSEIHFENKTEPDKIRFVSAVSKAGIMGAFSPNTFKPEEAATRADVALAIAAALKYRNCIPEAKASPFTDIEGNPAQSAILTVYSAGIISGFEDGTFRPGTITNREQAVSMLNKLMQRPVLIPATATFEDVPDSRWSFGAIESATHNQVVNPFN